MRKRKLFITLVSIVVGVFLLELGVQLCKLAPTVYRMRLDFEKSAYEPSSNPVLGYVLKPHYRDPDPDLQESFPFTNSYGQRDIERTIRKKKDTKRILMLGDSVVAGYGIRELDNTISRQLEFELKDKNVEVLNFGIGGYCTRAEVELLKVKGLDFDPDIVLFVFVNNDYVNENEQIYNYRYRHADDEAGISSLPRKRPEWIDNLFVHSHLFRFLCMKLTGFYTGRSTTHTL